MHLRRNDDRLDDPSPSPRDDGNVDIEIDDVEFTAARAEQYQDWVERMRRKRHSDKQRILGADDEASPTYWRSEEVFREGQRLADGHGAHRSTAQLDEMLEVLGLSGDPSLREIELAFRRLAMQHHPDRHVDADDDTRSRHLAQMRRINEAYAELRRLRSS